jgi:hypothetical protein
MNLPPLLAKRGESGAQSYLDMGDSGSGASVVFPEFQRTIWAMYVPYGRPSRADDMDMRWPVIIRIDDYPEPSNSANRQYTIIYTKPKRLGIII